jgi:FkbM family methyltransferase
MSPHVDRVFSFEPYAAVRSKLLEKIAWNNLTNVTVCPVGLGDVNAELDFFEPSGAGNGLGSFIGDQRPDSRVQKLPVWNGDEFLGSNGLLRMDIVKIDVEGFEYRVLLGLRERLRQERPVILMEVSPATRSEMVSESAFRQHLYEDARLFEVSAVNISSSYRLRPFRFESSGEILIVPGEKIPLFPFCA